MFRDVTFMERLKGDSVNAGVDTVDLAGLLSEPPLPKNADDDIEPVEAIDDDDDDVHPFVDAYDNLIVEEDREEPINQPVDDGGNEPVRERPRRQVKKPDRYIEVCLAEINEPQSFQAA